jgi:membrane fusion protein (multidrug efflux system)
LRWALLAGGPVLIVTIVLYTYLTGGRYVSIDNAYVHADKVDIAADIGGTVKSVDVHENQRVAAGDVLYRLRDGRLRNAVARAEGQLAATRTDIEALKASYGEKLESMRQAQIDIAYYQREFERKSDLAQHGAAATSQLDLARHDLDTAQEKLRMLAKELTGIVANLAGDPNIPVEEHPRVRAAAADLDEAQRQLRHATVRAPFAGIVTQVHNVQPGAYLAAAQPAFALVAADHVWVEANPKETELTYVRSGQTAIITVDSYPGVQWEGQVESLSPASGAEFALLPAQNTSGNWIKVVQRIPVEIRVDMAADKPVLRAGMSVVVTVDTHHRRAMPPVVASLLGLSPLAKEATAAETPL